VRNCGRARRNPVQFVNDRGKPGALSESFRHVRSDGKALVPSTAKGAVALTDNCDVFVGVNEDALNRLVRHVVRQRPSLVNLGSLSVVAVPLKQ